VVEDSVTISIRLDFVTDPKQNRSLLRQVSEEHFTGQLKDDGRTIIGLSVRGQEQSQGFVPGVLERRFIMIRKAGSDPAGATDSSNAK